MCGRGASLALISCRCASCRWNWECGPREFGSEHVSLSTRRQMFPLRLCRDPSSEAGPVNPLQLPPATTRAPGRDSSYVSCPKPRPNSHPLFPARFRRSLLSRLIDVGASAHFVIFSSSLLHLVAALIRAGRRCGCRGRKKTV